MDLSDIRDLTRALLSEATASYWTDIELNSYINYGLDDFTNQTDCLEDISTDSTVAHQSDYTLPTDYTRIKFIEIINGTSIYYVQPQSLYEQFTGTVKTTNSILDAGNIWGNTLRLSQRPSSAAKATTLSGAISTGTTVISFASATGWPGMGRFLIDSEVIEYFNLSSTTASVCSRGKEGTTDTSHLTGATVTLRDIWIYHNKKNTTLSTDTDEPEIPSQFHLALAYYAAWLGRIKSKDYDLAAGMRQIYDKYVAEGKEWARFRWRRVNYTR